MKVLVFVEQRDGKIKQASYEALALARKIAGGASNVAALLVGQSVDALAGELKGTGADKVFTVNGDAFKLYNVVSYAAALEESIKNFGAQLILGMATPMGRDLFPRLAARLSAGILTDVITLEAQGNQMVGTKPMYAGKCLAQVATQNCETHFVTIRPNVFPSAKSGDGAAAVQALNVTPNTAVTLKTKEIRKGKSEKADLTEAATIISGGRALGSAENFKVLEECANVIGATVGASRAAVDSGYATHDMQVGQTGKTVNPNLYIACGISGSIQHMAGMRTSKVIVAVNTDPEAPIFTVANYGIVADLFEAVPVMTKKFKELLGH